MIFNRSGDIRFLPAPAGERLYRAIRFHRPLGVLGKASPCHKKCIGDNVWAGDCGYCDLWVRLWKIYENTKKEEDLRLAREIKPTARLYIVGVERERAHAAGVWAGPYLGLKDIILPGLEKAVHYYGMDFRLVKAAKHSGVQISDYSHSHYLSSSRAGSREDWERWLESSPKLSTLVKLESAAVVEQNCKLYYNPAAKRVKRRTVYRSIDDEWNV